MAGIKINNSETWVVATWVHSFTVQLLLRHLAPSAPDQLREILELDEQSGLGFFSVEAAEADTIAELKTTVELVSQQLRSGEEVFEEKDVLPSYLERLEELQHLLATDRRVDSPH